MRRFAQVDVFGDGDGYGNPVAVVLDAEGLGDAQLQAFADWTNLSETTFLLPPTDPQADYRVRIFTPTTELPFAGHPTLGSAHAWLQAAGEPRDRVVQQCEAGLIAVRRDGERLAFAAPPLRRSGPLDDATLARVCDTLGVTAAEVLDHAWTDNGPGWASVLLSSAEQVLAIRPRPAGIRDVGVIGLHPDGTPELRAFVSFEDRVDEDPVTGSLNAGVAQWLLGSGALSAPYVARQGTALGRRGRIHVDRDADATIWVGGLTRTVTQGTVALGE